MRDDAGLSRVGRRQFSRTCRAAQAPDRWDAGTYDTPTAVIAVCKHIVDRSLRLGWFSFGGAEGRICLYRAFGDDPIIRVEDGAPAEHQRPLFSAWSYAEARCNALPLERLKRWLPSVLTARKV